MNTDLLASLVVTLLPLIFLGIRHFVSSFKMDDYTIYLLLIAVTPWIVPWIKTVELPGVGKVDFNGMRDAAKQAGLLEESESADLLSKAKSFIPSGSDTKGKLATMWVGLADNLSNLAELHNMPQQKDIRSTIDSLSEKKLIDGNQHALLLGVANIFNGVLKGKTIDSRIAELALKVGPQLSIALKQLAVPDDNQSKE